MKTKTETSSADEAEAMQIDEAPLLQDWRDQYLNWIIRGVLPSDHAQARRIARRAKSFALIDRELYKHSPSGIWIFPRVGSCFGTSTPELAATTRRHAPLWVFLMLRI
jgi:hypothetical protein